MASNRSHATSIAKRASSSWLTAHDHERPPHIPASPLAAAPQNPDRPSGIRLTSPDKPRLQTPPTPSSPPPRGTNPSQPRLRDTTPSVAYRSRLCCSGASPPKPTGFAAAFIWPGVSDIAQTWGWALTSTAAIRRLVGGVEGLGGYPTPKSYMTMPGGPEH